MGSAPAKDQWRLSEQLDLQHGGRSQAALCPHSMIEDRSARDISAMKIHLRAQTFGNLWRYLRNVRFLSSKKLQRADVLFFSADANKSETVVGGQKFDRYLDTLGSLAKSEGFSIKSIAWPGNFYHGKKTWVETLNITWPSLVAFVRDALSREPGSERHRISFFVATLEAINPRVIFTIGGTSPLRLAASSLEIPCVEVLHARGYHTSPEAWFAPRELPSHALAFDEISRDLLVKHCGQKCEVILTKDYWITAWRNQSQLRAKASPNTLPEFEFAPNRADVPYRILVSLQWGYGGDSTRYVGEARGKIFENGLFPMNLVEAIRALGESAFWHFRLHPVQLNSGRRLYRNQRKYLDQLFRGHQNVDILNPSRAPLPTLLSECTHNITTSSSLCYEAAEFGIPTLTTSPLLLSGEPLQDRFRDLASEGYLTKVEPDYPDIANWVIETIPMAPRHKSDLGRSIEDVLNGFIAKP